MDDFRKLSKLHKMKTMRKSAYYFLTILVLMAISCSTKQPNQTNTLNILVGTYTDNNESQGVYLYEFDTETAGSKLLDTAAAGNPSFIIASEDRNFAYAVSEYMDDRQGVYSFTLGDGSVDLLNYVQDGCAGPCNIVIAGGNALTADYGGGTLSAFPVLEDGSVGKMSFQFVPEKDGDTKSHIHCTAVSPDGKYIFVTDLGADAIYRATVVEGSAPVDFVTAYKFDAAVHPGPRHLTFSQDGRFAYLLGEPGDCLSVFKYQDGTLQHISTQKAYDADGRGSADIHISPDGRFVYTSHRLKGDGIAVFSRNADDGSVENVGFCPTGKHPRNFAITPDGRWLLCACRDDNRIEVYSIDKETGMLSAVGKTIDVPAPVCICIY